MGRSDQEWVDQLGGRSPDAALAALRDLLLRGLRPALADYGVTDTDLEDFVQDGLVRILQNLATYRGEARFTTWAQKICVRVALTELRRRRWRDVSLEEFMGAARTPHAKQVDLADTRPEPGRQVDTEMVMAALQRMIAEELTDLQRTAMTAVMQSGMPLQEVAERLGTNRNALYKLLHDGRRRLKARMEAEGYAPHELLALIV